MSKHTSKSASSSEARYKVLDFLTTSTTPAARVITLATNDSPSTIAV